MFRKLNNQEKIMIFLLMLILIFSILYLQIFYKTITILVSSVVSLFLKIGEYAEGYIYILYGPESVVSGGIAEFKTEFKNYGSLNLDVVKEEFLIVNSKGETVFHRNVTELHDVKAGESKFFVYQLVAGYPSGEYSAFIKAYFVNESSNIANWTFVVTSIIPKPPLGLPKGPLSPSPANPNISVEYPSKINVTQDTTYTLIIKVTNNGDVSLHNLGLTLSSSDMTSRVIYPLSVPEIYVSESEIFVSEISVPLEIDPGIYFVEWVVSSDEIIKRDRIEVEVIELPIRDRARELIVYYTDLITKVEKEIKNVENEKNVTIARDLLEEAKTELNIAKDFFRLGLYQETLDQIGKVKTKINECVIALGKAESLLKAPIIRMPALFQPIYLLIIIVVVLISIMFFLIKQKRGQHKLIGFERW
jgi:hypothetical protein